MTKGEMKAMIAKRVGRKAQPVGWGRVRGTRSAQKEKCLPVTFEGAVLTLREGPQFATIGRRNEVVNGTSTAPKTCGRPHVYIFAPLRCDFFN